MVHLSRIDRRALLAGLTLLPFSTFPAFALSEAQAQKVVESAVGDINKIIASGRSESAMIGDFRKVFNRYADVPIVALSALGAAGRSASKGQKRAYISAFSDYFTRKYGRRFREFAGGKIEVESARKTKSFYEVRSTAKLPGTAPFKVSWLISDKGGKPKIFNIIIEGVNTLTTERVEIGAMLDKRGGDIGKLTSHLKSLG